MESRTDWEPGLLLRTLRSPLVRLILLVAFLFYAYISGHMFRSAFAKGALQDLLAVAWMIALSLFVYVTFVHVVERRPVSELSLPGMGRELGAGLLLGASLYTACVVILMALGVYRIDGLNNPYVLLSALWFALSSAFFEEMLFRGVLLRITQEVFGGWVGLAVSSAAFGLIHMNNADATLRGAIFIAIEAGVLLGAAYMLTGRLWMSMGFHAAWNYTQSAVFSGINSGNEPSRGLVRTNIQGPDLLTGGSFGMEGSVVALALLTTTGVIMLVLAARRGRIAPPFWNRSA